MGNGISQHQSNIEPVVIPKQRLNTKALPQQKKDITYKTRENDTWNKVISKDGKVSEKLWACLNKREDSNSSLGLGFPIVFLEWKEADENESIHVVSISIQT